MTVSSSRGKAEIKAVTYNLKPSIFVTVLKGLNTLNTLKLEILMLEEPKVEIQPMITIMKSKIFQASLMYAPLLNTNPSANILRSISRVYRTRKTQSIIYE